MSRLVDEHGPGRRMLLALAVPAAFAVAYVIILFVRG